MSPRSVAVPIVAIVSVVVASCSPVTDGPDRSTTSATTATTSTVDQQTRTDRTEDSEAALVRAILARSPQTITELGLDEEFGLDASQLDDLSPSFRDETASMARTALDSMGEEPSTARDRVSWVATKWYLEDLIDLGRFSAYEYGVDFITGAHTTLPEFMADVHPVDTMAGAEAYVARLAAAGDQMRQVAQAVRLSTTAGVVPTGRTASIVRWQIEDVLRPPDDHPLVVDFVERLEASGTFSADQIARLRSDAIGAIARDLLPGYASLLETVESAPTRGDADAGVGSLPAGRSYYAAALRHFASLDVDPDDVHRLGLDHVARLEVELTAALEDLGYDVSASGFAAAVRASTRDAGSFALVDDAARRDTLALAEADIQRASQLLAGLFDRHPAAELEVVRPRPGRESGSGAYYRAPPADGSRPGIYYLSLGGATLDRQTFSTTNFHEAIPGHHFQLALQREATELPLLQRAMVYSGFAEGWALYAERLAYEAGLYDDDPSGNVGRLRMELLRAARAVADTGIHHLGWSRSRAIGYLEELGFDESQAQSEVDRYITWPGQAPSYLIGMLEILRLREHARSTLGEDFDLAAFHDAVLSHGGIPLVALEIAIDEFIAGT